MNNTQFSRTELLLGKEAVERLQSAHVAIFGIGGVGGYVCEALARAGVGHLTVIDRDTVSESNINRQIIATHSNIGRLKVEAMKTRIADINPDCEVTALPIFYLPENADTLDLSAFDYVVDAVDTVSAKVEMICRATALGIPIISAMGTGNKLHPELFEVSDISKTTVCPLARAMRKALKDKGIHHVKVVYSREVPHSAMPLPYDEEAKKTVPASFMLTPAACGLLLAGEVICDLTKGE